MRHPKFDFLGKGKSGYSYKSHFQGRPAVLKQIHDEPCAYYAFTDKFGSELDAYRRLREMEIPVPELWDHDPEARWLLKEFIEGPTVAELVGQGRLEWRWVEQIWQLSLVARAKGFNLDFFPTNFIASDNGLFYVDYELAPYTQEWDFEHWGIFYWANQLGMAEFLTNHNPLAINESESSGKPVQGPYRSLAASWLDALKHSERPSFAMPG